MPPRVRCTGKKKNGEPCSLYAIPGQFCCRFHTTQCISSVPEFYVDESTFEDADTEAIMEYTKANFPFKKFENQVPGESVLEDFADALARTVRKIEDRRWNVLVAKDGSYGLVGPLNEEYDTNLCIMTIITNDGGLVGGFVIYIF